MTAETTQTGSWVEVTTTDKIPAGKVIHVAPAGTHMALANIAGKLFAVDARCPHKLGPLARGTVQHNEIVCPWHRFRFDVRTGQSAAPAATFSVRTYPVRTVDDRVQILLEHDIDN